MRRLIYVCLCICLCTVCGCSTSTGKSGDAYYTDEDGNTYGISAEDDIYCPEIFEQSGVTVEGDSFDWTNGILYLNDTTVGPELTLQKLLDIGYIPMEDITSFTYDTLPVTLTIEDHIISVIVVAEEGKDVKDCSISQVTCFEKGCTLVSDIPKNATQDVVVEAYGKPYYSTAYSETATSATYVAEGKNTSLEVSYNDAGEVTGMTIYLPARFIN